MKLEGKSVVVTGASAGMGKAIVTLFVKEGANVIAVARRQQRLEDLAEELKNEAGKIIPFVGDISKREDNEAMIDRAVAEFGRLDILINNAGVMDDMSPIADVSDERYEHVMAINAYGPLCSTRKAVQVFLAQGDGGNIINIVSVGAERCTSGPVYCMSKGAELQLMRTTAYMYQDRGIRCNAISPGAISTEISTSMGRPNMEGYTRVKKLLALGPAELGKPEDIANAALFLATEASRYINGEILHVDGGFNVG